MLKKQKTRIALIGAGGIAQAYSQSFNQCQHAELVGVADIRKEAAQTLADMHGCPAVLGYEQLLDQVAFDAVLVCTPPVTHPEICKFFLEKGIHVLCEKPLAIDSENARSIIESSERSGAKFTMASKFRYVDDVIKAKALLTSGILGELILFENSFAGHVDMSSRWNSDPIVRWRRRID